VAISTQATPLDSIDLPDKQYKYHAARLPGGSAGSGVIGQKPSARWIHLALLAMGIETDSWYYGAGVVLALEIEPLS
jgi:hypothetical protein